MSKESDRKEIHRILHRMVASPFRAILGDGGGTVDVAGKTGYVWARKLGQEEKVFQAFNRGISDPNEGRVVLVQESRVEGLPGYEVVGSAGGDFATSTSVTKNDCTLVRVDANGDEDYDPYTSTSWDGDSFSTGNGTINWSLLFNVPAGAKMVQILLIARDAVSTGGSYYIRLKAKSTTTFYSIYCYAPRSVDDEPGSVCGWVPVAADGTSYYSITASGANTFDVWIWVVAYAK